MSSSTCPGAAGLRQLVGGLWRLGSAPAAWFAEFTDSAEDIWDHDALLDYDDEWLCC